MEKHHHTPLNAKTEYNSVKKEDSYLQPFEQAISKDAKLVTPKTPSEKFPVVHDENHVTNETPLAQSDNVNVPFGTSHIPKINSSETERDALGSPSSDYPGDPMEMSPISSGTDRDAPGSPDPDYPEDAMEVSPYSSGTDRDAPGSTDPDYSRGSMEPSSEFLDIDKDAPGTTDSDHTEDAMETSSYSPSGTSQQTTTTESVDRVSKKPLKRRRSNAVDEDEDPQYAVRRPGVRNGYTGGKYCIADDEDEDSEYAVRRPGVRNVSARERYCIASDRTGRGSNPDDEDEDSEYAVRHPGARNDYARGRYCIASDRTRRNSAKVVDYQESDDDDDE